LRTTAIGLILGVQAVVGEPGLGQLGDAVKYLQISSIPVSPSVVATVATRGGRLVLLVLWRGAPRWHSSACRRVQGGGDQRGRIMAMLHCGDQELNLTFDSATHTAIVQGKSHTFPADTNVLMIDGVDTPGRGDLTTSSAIDGADVDLNPRLGLGAWTSLLGRSPGIVEFLQCDEVPVDERSIEPCQRLRTR
jgi:hypothetical protein